MARVASVEFAAKPDCRALRKWQGVRERKKHARNTQSSLAVDGRTGMIPGGSRAKQRCLFFIQCGRDFLMVMKCPEFKKKKIKIL